MLVLGIESSCDETAVALYDSDVGLLAHQLHSQVAIHADYGGVVPELASRNHICHLIPLIERCLDEAKRPLAALDIIAYTQGPGLAGALLVAASVANGIGFALNKPVIGIHHLEGHLLSAFLAETTLHFPFVALLVSGGHTQLIAVRQFGDYQLLGETLDDAAGEAFDKTAKHLNLGYPGGAAVSEAAQQGNPTRFQLPRPMLCSTDLNFSFAGLKTAVVHLHNRHNDNSPQTRADICAAFQQAIVDVLIHKAHSALQHTGMQRLVVVGGVSANKQLREALRRLAHSSGYAIYCPDLQWCTDNAAMIALAGAKRHQQAHSAGSFSIKTRWDLSSLAKPSTTTNKA